MTFGIGRRQFISVLGGATVAWPLEARTQQTERMRRIGEEAMANIRTLSFDKEGMLEGQLPVVGPEITDVVLISHGWNETPEGARDNYQHLVDPLEVILSQNKAQWQGHAVAYFGVIWPSAKYADDLTVINMRADVGEPLPAGLAAGAPTALPLNDADLEARARDVAQFLEINPD